jgi:tetratricopeptide (TPR) repeat protein
VLGGVAAMRDISSARFFPVASSTPPTLEAFVEYGEGRQLAGQNRLAEAIKRFRWAVVLDTMFTWPLVEAAVAELQLGERAPTDSALVTLTRVRDRLTPLQKDVIAFVEASRAENWPEASRALRVAAQLAPERYAYRYAISATHVNRPREVVAALSYPGLDTLHRNATVSYWNVLTLAYHQLGDHETELAVARRARSHRKGSLVALTQEIRSLAAVGRSAKVLSLLDSAASLPREGWFTPAWSMETAARELRAHGHIDAARAALEQAVAWHRHRPSEEEATEARRAQLADVFYLLGDLDNAEREYTALFAMDSTNASYLAALGTIAGRRGRRSTAESIAVRLQTMERAVPLPGNDATLGRAKIAAILGDHRQALVLLVQAFGPAGTNMLHDDVDFEGLRNDPRFREFIRPKG